MPDAHDAHDAQDTHDTHDILACTPIMIARVDALPGISVTTSPPLGHVTILDEEQIKLDGGSIPFHAVVSATSDGPAPANLEVQARWQRDGQTEWEEELMLLSSLHVSARRTPQP